MTTVLHTSKYCALPSPLEKSTNYYVYHIISFSELIMDVYIILKIFHNWTQARENSRLMADLPFPLYTLIPSLVADPLLWPPLPTPPTDPHRPSPPSFFPTPALSHPLMPAPISSRHLQEPACQAGQSSWLANCGSSPLPPFLQIQPPVSLHL